MKYVIGFVCFFFSLGLSAQEAPAKNKAIKRFVYQKNSRIVKRVYDSVYFDFSYEAGNKWVFKFSHQLEESPLVSDDEYTETFEFEIDPPKGNRFRIAEGDFEKHQVIFNRSCFCPDGGPRQLYEGTITGKRVRGNTWLISFEGMIQARPGKDFAPYEKKWKAYFKPNQSISK